MNKFSPKWNPQYVDKLREHLQSGERFTSFSRVIKVDERTLYRWCKEYTSFREVREAFDQTTRVKIYA